MTGLETFLIVVCVIILIIIIIICISPGCVLMYYQCAKENAFWKHSDTPPTTSNLNPRYA